MTALLAQLASVRHRVQIFRSLRHRDFRWFWLSTTAQAAARGMQFLILGWLVLVLTDSSSQLGLVIFLYGVPNLAFVLFGGIIADRIDRRKMLICTQAAVSAIIFILAILMVTDSIVIWHLYAATLLLGTLQAINMPARMAIVSDLVERDDLMNAVVLNSAVMNSGRILGPALAGGLIELYGIGVALYVNAFLYLISVVSLVVVRHVSAIRPGRKSSILGDLFEGRGRMKGFPDANQRAKSDPPLAQGDCAMLGNLLALGNSRLAAVDGQRNGPMLDGSQGDGACPRHNPFVSKITSPTSPIRGAVKLRIHSLIS